MHWDIYLCIYLFTLWLIVLTVKESNILALSMGELFQSKNIVAPHLSTILNKKLVKQDTCHEM